MEELSKSQWKMRKFWLKSIKENLNEMTQTNISPHISVDGMVYNRDQKRAIVHACSRVGKGIFITMRENVQENNPNTISNPNLEIEDNVNAYNAYDDEDFANFNEYYIDNNFENNSTEAECEEIVYNGDEDRSSYI
jgi:hypothetical protein